MFFVGMLKSFFNLRKLEEWLSETWIRQMWNQDSLLAFCKTTLEISLDFHLVLQVIKLIHPRFFKYMLNSIYKQKSLENNFTSTFHTKNVLIFHFLVKKIVFTLCSYMEIYQKHGSWQIISFFCFPLSHTIRNHIWVNTSKK